MIETNRIGVGYFEGDRENVERYQKIAQGLLKEVSELSASFTKKSTINFIRLIVEKFQALGKVIRDVGIITSQTLEDMRFKLIYHQLTQDPENAALVKTEELDQKSETETQTGEETCIPQSVYSKTHKILLNYGISKASLKYIEGCMQDLARECKKLREKNYALEKENKVMKKKFIDFELESIYDKYHESSPKARQTMADYVYRVRDNLPSYYDETMAFIGENFMQPSHKLETLYLK